MSTTLRSDDKISVVKTTGNNKPEYYPISELNELISSEEDTRIAALEALYPEFGVPVAATQSTAVLCEGELDEITLTSVAYGVAENNYKINLIVPETVNEIRTIEMPGSFINITVKTELDGEAVIVSASETATAIAAAISADATVGAVFQAAATGTGSTVIAASDLNIKPTGGQDATIANAGQLFIDSANNLIYVCVADTDGTEIVLDVNWKTLTLTAISS